MWLHTQEHIFTSSACVSADAAALSCIPNSVQSMGTEPLSTNVYRAMHWETLNRPGVSVSLTGPPTAVKNYMANKTVYILGAKKHYFLGQVKKII